MTPEILIADPTEHTYHTVSGRKLMSNTDFLAEMGFSDYSDLPEELRQPALELGSDVHYATALLDNGGNWRKAYSYLSGYVAAWKKVKKDFKFKPTIIEQPMYDPHYMIATTPDRWGWSAYLKGNLTAQIKMGKVEPWVGLQLSFEEHCIFLDRECRDDNVPRYRFAFELRSDGTYKPYRFDDDNDIKVFLSAHVYYQWLRNHNCLKGDNHGREKHR